MYWLKILTISFIIQFEYRERESISVHSFGHGCFWLFSFSNFRLIVLLTYLFGYWFIVYLILISNCIHSDWILWILPSKMLIIFFYEWHSIMDTPSTRSDQIRRSRQFTNRFKKKLFHHSEKKKTLCIFWLVCLTFITIFCVFVSI